MANQTLSNTLQTPFFANSFNASKSCREFKNLNGDKNRRLRICRSNLGDYATSATLVYGTILLGGGTIAYLRRGSKGSLGGGLTGGALMGLSYYLLQNPQTEGLGNSIGFGVALLFSAVFGIRLAATRKAVLTGPLLASSLVAAAIFATAYSG